MAISLLGMIYMVTSFEVYIGKFKSVMIIADRYESFISSIDSHIILIRFFQKDKMVAIFNEKDVKKIITT